MSEKRVRLWKGDPEEVFERAREILEPLGFVCDSQLKGGCWLLAPKEADPSQPLTWVGNLSLLVAHDHLTLRAETHGWAMALRRKAFTQAVLGFLLVVVLDSAATAWGWSITLLSLILAMQCLVIPAAMYYRRRRALRGAFDELVGSLVKKSADSSAKLSSKPLSSEVRTEAVRPAQRCSYCHDDLGEEALMVCPRCETRFHPDCWGELKSCPTLGCGNRLEREPGGKSPPVKVPTQ